MNERENTTAGDANAVARRPIYYGGSGKRAIYYGGNTRTMYYGGHAPSAYPGYPGGGVRGRRVLLRRGRGRRG